MRAKRRKATGDQVNESAYVFMACAYSLMSEAYDKLRDEMKEVKSIADTW